MSHEGRWNLIQGMPPTGTIKVTHAALNRQKEAVIAYEQALELDPENATYWNDKGNALRADPACHEDALEAYEQAVKLAPDEPLYWHNKGRVLHYDLKRHEEALATFEQALELDPGNASCWNDKAIA